MNFRGCFTTYLATLVLTLPQERLLGLARERKWTERVFAYLESAQKKEIDPWLRDDLRISWITVKWAGEGVPEGAWHRDRGAHAAATYQVLGCSACARSLRAELVRPSRLPEERSPVRAPWRAGQDSSGRKVKW